MRGPPLKRPLVRQRPQISLHLCHWPNCKTSVPPRFWGCKRHWFKLPSNIRRKIWATYRPGQEIDKRPSEEYIEAALEAQHFAFKHPD